MQERAKMAVEHHLGWPVAEIGDIGGRSGGAACAGPTGRAACGTSGLVAPISVSLTTVRLLLDSPKRSFQGAGTRSTLPKWQILAQRVPLISETYIQRGRPREVREETLTTPVPLGLSGLDDALRGELPRNSVAMVLGATGSGKTILGLQFLAEGPGVVSAACTSASTRSRRRSSGRAIASGSGSGRPRSTACSTSSGSSPPKASSTSWESGCSVA
jgi:hypothetical protein